ncbi:MAG TPA: PIN domain-containing protein [Candidatus Bathyarchaeia archaeon]|nr:PIN domain-containing protein [Candidatus Bathyarchaeia archaeon]
MAILLDTGFLTGISHPMDEQYSTSARILGEMSEGKYGLIYTTPLVIAETATLLLIRSRNNRVVVENFYSYLYGEEKFIRILPWNTQIEELTWAMFREINKDTREKKNYVSFVDAANIAYCRQYQIQYIASFDSHFDAFLIRIH